MLKKRGIIVLILFIILVSCTSEGKERELKSQEEKKIQIGMSFDSFIIERWQRDRDVFVSVAKELGAEVNMQNANGDIEEQKKQIEYFISKGMDVIVIIGIDSQGLKESVQKAKEAGVKVIAYDRLLCESDVDLYISFDNESVGKMMGEALVKNGISGKNVLMIGGSPTDNNVKLVEDGFNKVLQGKNVTILDRVHADGWRAELAAEYIYEHFDIVSETQAIMCGNDDLAGQAVRALSEKQKAGEILVVGQDAELAACQRIVEGTQLMTVYKPVEKLATRAAQAAIALANGEIIEGDDVMIIQNGEYKIPYIALTPISVTSDNMNEIIIESGFHLKEDVYLNVPGKMPE